MVLPNGNVYSYNVRARRCATKRTGYRRGKKNLEDKIVNNNWDTCVFSEILSSFLSRTCENAYHLYIFNILTVSSGTTGDGREERRRSDGPRDRGSVQFAAVPKGVHLLVAASATRHGNGYILYIFSVESM